MRDQKKSNRNRFERLTDRYTTVGSLYLDSSCTWIVYLAPKRSTLDMCRWKGEGDTLDQAIDMAIQASTLKTQRPEAGS